MASKIPQPFIDQVLNQTDIVDLVNGYVELKQKGREYTACCPFHNEKTPSFTVSPDKQFYHCFGCGAHGTAISFLIEHEGLEFLEAIELLASRLGIQVPREQGHTPVDHDQDLYRALDLANRYYQQQLRASQPARHYLKKRGITPEIAELFNIGYAPNGFNNITSQLGKTLTQELLIQSGLLAKKETGRIYDRFRHRIMFPIKDLRGRVIAFGARAFGDAMPKYINSPETPLFNKSNSLYGLYEARKSPGRISQLLIVEGYMDVVALAQHGINNSVATLGTSTTNQHITKLLRYSSDLIFCFDGDRAGNAAAWKALQQMLPEYKDGIDIRFAFMPQGEDPDSLIRNAGEEIFTQYLQKSLPLSEFFFIKLSKEIDTSTPDGCAKLASVARPLLAKLPPSIFRDLMYKELNVRVGTPVAQPQPSSLTANADNHAKPVARAPKYTKTRLAIALLLREPKLAHKALPREDLAHLDAVPGIPLLIQLLEIIEDNPGLTPAALIERFRGQEAYAHLQKLLEWDPPDMANRSISFEQTMDRFKQDVHRASLDGIIAKEP